MVSRSVSHAFTTNVRTSLVLQVTAEKMKRKEVPSWCIHLYRSIELDKVFIRMCGIIGIVLANEDEHVSQRSDSVHACDTPYLFVGQRKKTLTPHLLSAHENITLRSIKCSLTA